VHSATRPIRAPGLPIISASPKMLLSKESTVASGPRHVEHVSCPVEASFFSLAHCMIRTATSRAFKAASYAI
jgi:hypothetical protein